MAKEHFSPSGACHCVETDMWAFGMVIFELLARKEPYADLASNYAIAVAIGRGQLPEKPDFTNHLNTDVYHGLWSICCDCWHNNPSERVSGAEVLQKVAGLSNSMGKELESQSTQLQQPVADALARLGVPHDDATQRCTQLLNLDQAGESDTGRIIDVSLPDGVKDVTVEQLRLQIADKSVANLDLEALVELIEKINELCVNLRRNRTGTRQLVKVFKAVCSVMLEQLDERKDIRVSILVSRRSLHRLASFQMLLVDTRDEMKRWSEFRYWEAIANQASIANIIGRYGRQANMISRKRIGMFRWSKPIFSMTQVGYTELYRKDLQETIRELARSSTTNELRQLVSDAKNNGETDDIRRAMGHLIQVVRFRFLFFFIATSCNICVSLKKIF